MRFDILTLFPEYFDSPLKQSVIGKAIEAGLVSVRAHNIRDWTTDKHKTADDSPYGGGPGMVMKVEPIVAAIEAVSKARKSESDPSSSRVVLLSPQGAPFDQAKARELSALKNITFVCGRYEGVDERVRSFVDEEISVGDYILTGGEAAALIVIEAVSRLVDGVIDAESPARESFCFGHDSGEPLLEYAQYTRPAEFRGVKVPEVLLSGNHEAIEKWRKLNSIERTRKRRPDLLGPTGQEGQGS